VILLIALISIAAVYADFAGELKQPTTQVKGLDYVLTPNITHDPDRSYTVIEATVENRGFEKVLVTLPKDWEFDPEIYSATGEPIIVSKGKLHRKYGHPDERSSFISNHYVFWQRGGFAISKGSPWLIKWSDGSESYGWYIYPNERLKFTIKMRPKEDEAVIDPLALEQNRSDIKVVKWNEEFVVYPDKDTPTGFLRAPWIVKNATLVSAYPGIFSNLSAFGTEYYWHSMKLEALSTTTTTLQEELNPPAWDEWFNSGGGLFKLTQVSLAQLTTELPAIPVLNKTPKKKPEKKEFIPVWLVDHTVTFVRYSYEWHAGREVPGIDVELYTEPHVTLSERYGNFTAPAPKEERPPLDLSTVPEWYAWFLS